MSDADAAQLLPPPLTGRFQCDGSSEFCSHPLMTWYRSAFDRKRYLAAFAMAKAAAWSCVKRFDAGRANHSRMIAFRASACVIALALQAWPRLRNLPHAQRSIAHDYRPEADALRALSHDSKLDLAIQLERHVGGGIGEPSRTVRTHAAPDRCKTGHDVSVRIPPALWQTRLGRFAKHQHRGVARP
jgi:hypothetical protein